MKYNIIFLFSMMIYSQTVSMDGGLRGILKGHAGWVTTCYEENGNVNLVLRAHEKKDQQRIADYTKKDLDDEEAILAGMREIQFIYTSFTSFNGVNANKERNRDIRNISSLRNITQ